MSVIVSEQYEFVIGVDTHAATHTFAVVAAGTGAALGQEVFPTSPAGLARAQAWLRGQVGAQPTLVVVEGTGSFGAILTDRLLAARFAVVEAPRMPAGGRRGTGKSDVLDAVRIARAVLGLSQAELRVPRALSTDRARVAMRVLVVAREQMTGERTRAVNALIALVRTVDLGVDARTPLTTAQITAIAAWRNRTEDVTTATCRGEAVRLARRVRTLDADLATNRSGITTLVSHDTPELLELTGVGPVVAAGVLIAWSHPGRVRSEAALASLAGTCPVPASSGNTVRHRLNRGGDRRLNRVLTTITIVRMRVDPATRAYVTRRRAEGRTTKRSCGHSSATSPASCSVLSPPHTRSRPVDGDRSIPGLVEAVGCPAWGRCGDRCAGRGVRQRRRVRRSWGRHPRCRPGCRAGCSRGTTARQGSAARSRRTGRR